VEPLYCEKVKFAYFNHLLFLSFSFILFQLVSVPKNYFLLVTAFFFFLFFHEVYLLSSPSSSPSISYISPLFWLVSPNSFIFLLNLSLYLLIFFLLMLFIRVIYQNLRFIFPKQNQIENIYQRSSYC